MPTSDTLPATCRFGIFTDSHYALIPPKYGCYYNESLEKLSIAASTFEREAVDFIVALGDLIDVDENPEADQRNLTTLVETLRKTERPLHFVLGNHCIETISRQRFFDITGQSSSIKAFSYGGFRFILLDACFRYDEIPYFPGNFHWTESEIPWWERQWLLQELERAPEPVIVLLHQRIDLDRSEFAIRSASSVRRILELSGKVLAVIQGHSHNNEYREINGIHYVTLRAMVQGSGLRNNAFAIVELVPGVEIRLRGFYQQASYRLPLLTRHEHEIKKPPVGEREKTIRETVASQTSSDHSQLDQ